VTTLRSRLVIENHRGRLVPRTLGAVLAGGLVAGAGVGAATRGGLAPAAGGLVAGALLVGAAGLVDDLSPGGPRGLRNHLRALLEGRLTTGLLKALVTVGAAVVTVGLQERGGAGVLLAGVALVAGTTNVMNGLDVRPGRALKGFLVVGGVACVGLATQGSVLVGAVVGTVAAGVVALPVDLRERAMLGDTGANLAGFVAGAALFGALPGSALLPAAAFAVALNLLADTIGFSRVIDATPPLRWLDRLGRLPDGSG
jgi:hypothetical protein